MAKVILPQSLQKLTDNLPEFKTEVSTVKEAVEELTQKYPQVKPKLYDDQGNLRKFVSIFLNEEDIEISEGEKASLRDKDILRIIIPLSGG